MTTYTTQFYLSYIPNNRTNKHNPNNQYSDTNAGFIFKFCNKSTSFVQFIHRQFVHFINPQKPVCGLMNSLVHFICPYMNPLPIPISRIPTLIFRIPTPFPIFSTSPPRFPAFPPAFLSFPPKFPAFPHLFPKFSPSFPAFLSFHSPILLSGFYR